jgi:DNA mismatch repair protein MSH5
LANLFQRIDASSIQSIYVILSDAIDVDATMDNQTVCIRDGYLDQLDRLRRIYSGLEDVLTDAAKKILQESPLLNHVAVEYVPQIGYLAVVEADEANLLDSSIFTFVYELDGRGYYKCATVYEMDETIGDIKGMIADLQKSILVNIEERILDAENQILELYVACGALDATLSLATVAKEMNFVKPEISEDNVIIIKNGRHPLQELTVDSFIPNDTYVSCEENVAIITGENGSGKSVYVKQVGLLVYLAHIGSFLPCEHAVIGLTDKILTRISSIESSCNPHSAFSMDLSQMKHIIGSNTSRSLCLIDEFGKGTSPTDGMALLAACILHFATLKCKAFFILHFTEIFDPQIINLKQWANIQVFKMEVYEAKDSQRGISAGEDKNLSLSDDYAVPLFKLHVGISKSSGALNCARVAGVKQSVLDRAAQILNCLVTKQTIPRPDGDTQSKPRFGGSTPGGDALRIFLSKDAAAWANASDTEVREIMNLLSKS